MVAGHFQRGRKVLRQFFFYRRRRSVTGNGTWKTTKSFRKNHPILRPILNFDTRVEVVAQAGLPASQGAFCSSFIVESILRLLNSQLQRQRL
jgi:hypothetical protein